MFPHSRHGRLLLGSLGVVARLLIGATVLADPIDAPNGPDAPVAPEASGAADTDATTNQAREEFLLGSQFARLNQWKDALDAFERSSALRPHVVTTYNIGYIERALGHLTRARMYLSNSLSTPEGAEPLPPDLANLARSYLAEIEQSLVRVPVSTSRDGIAVTVDGRPLAIEGDVSRFTLVAGTAQLGPPQPLPFRRFDLIADPGAHVIVLSAPGERDTVVSPVFEQGHVAPLQLELPSDRPSPAPAPPPRAEPRRATTKIPTASWIAFGVGAAGLATASVFGLLALSESSKLDSVCKPNHQGCPDSAQADLDRLHRYGTGADIAFGVGAAGAVTGVVVLWLSHGNEGSPEHGSLRVTPAVSASTVGLSLHGAL